LSSAADVVAPKPRLRAQGARREVGSARRAPPPRRFAASGVIAASKPSVYAGGARPAVRARRPEPASASVAKSGASVSESREGREDSTPVGGASQ